MKTLLILAALGQKVYGRWLFSRLIPGIIMVAGLILVTAIMVSAALIAALGVCYIALVHYGVAPYAAIITVALLTILSIVVLTFACISCLRRLRHMPRTLLGQSPLTSRAKNALDEFINGLMAE